MRSYSLRFKLSAIFLIVSLFVFAVIIIFSNFFLKKQFEDYTVAKLENTIGGTVSLISKSLDSSGGNWNIPDIENLGMNALSEGLIIRITDVEENVVWDANVHDNGMCVQILKHMAQNMQSYDKNFKGAYEEKEFSIAYNGVTEGSLYIGYYGPYYLSDADIQFIDSLNSFLIWAAAGTFVICLIFGAYIAKHLTKPIERVIETTDKISKGDFESRISEESNTKEIIKLTGSVNSLAETLDKQELLRKRLTADVAHELRTPLATLQSHLEAMIDDVWKPEKELLSGCHEEVLRLTKLVGELETLSQYDSENLKLQTELFDLSGLLRQILSNFEIKFKEKKIKSSFEGEKKIVEGDKDKLSQVFINIISNAIKFTPEGGKVDIKATEDGRTVSVRIKDTGIGITEKDLPYVFERFYRTDRSRSRKTGGSGIGLTIAKSIVKAHKGEIKAVSEEGKGSAFTVILPIRQESS